ncbi:ORF6N domain-containing protein [Sulfurovum sp.]|uniref:ORF6N domain-containing protein n=1 Tax=Sulfurovum sp. TaxID=1969726 RepID=UPI0025F34498|nr:ORF6N domain-containing protein [Sulfurovum sp.]
MNELTIPIHHKIYTLRGKQIMLDEDLASLYEVETKVFNQAVKRNNERFPDDFMFQLSEKEYENLKSQIATSS